MRPGGVQFLDERLHRPKSNECESP
jgi:hypothetical protein